LAAIAIDTDLGHGPARPRGSAFLFLFSDYDRPVRRSCTRPAVAGRMARLLCMISAISPFDQSAIGSYRERAGFIQYRACAASFSPFRSSLTSFRFAADITGSENCDAAHAYTMRVNPATKMLQMCRP
jgi:hypothetical protein